MLPETVEPYIAWLSAGVILCALEMIVPGVFLMWIGIAALLTGIAAWLLPIGTTVQLLLFAAAALASIYFGRRWTGSDTIVSDDPLLNDRIGRLIGEVIVVTEPIISGSGRARVADGEWMVRGPDTAAGQHVRVTGAVAGVLTVEPA
jgi:inner membrane protein